MNGVAYEPVGYESTCIQTKRLLLARDHDFGNSYNDRNFVILVN